MALRLEHAFVVKCPIDRVWAYLTDPYRVAPALPGAAITEKIDAETYAGTITVKVGPVAARYKGTVRFAAADPSARAAEIIAKGQDVSGRGGADMRMQSRLVERSPNETEVTVVSEVNVTGILAQLGRGMIQDVSNQMFGKFTEAMRAELEKPLPEATPATPAASAPAAAAAPAPSAPSAPPIEVVSFGGKILARALVRAMRRPAFWILAGLLILVVCWLWFR